MQRRIVLSYAMHDRDVREAIIAWLKAKNLPAPSYVANNPECTWYKDPEGVRVEWIEEGEIN